MHGLLSGQELVGRATDHAWLYLCDESVHRSYLSRVIIHWAWRPAALFVLVAPCPATAQTPARAATSAVATASARRQ